MTDNKVMINKSMLKTEIQKEDMRISKNSYETANDVLLDNIKKAIKRAKGNERKTVCSRDW